MIRKERDMKIFAEKDYNAMSKRAASIVAAQLIANPKSVLGLATGSSPIGTYQTLIEWYRQGYLDFSNVHAVNLDEYKGLNSQNPQSYAFFMKENLFAHVNINDENTHIPDGLALDVEAECIRYDCVIEKLGGIDLQLLGIGHNGHIGFNEPAESFATDTHCISLSGSTIEANSRLFEHIEEVPRFAYTMGIRPIMMAKKILIIASGSGKAEILRDAVCGPVTPAVPASILQLHPDVTLVADEYAMKGFKQGCRVNRC
jgi:glucosamine-6-phosphate deaminase